MVSRHPAMNNMHCDQQEQPDCVVALVLGGRRRRGRGVEESVVYSVLCSPCEFQSIVDAVNLLP